MARCGEGFEADAKVKGNVDMTLAGERIYINPEVEGRASPLIKRQYT